MPYNFDDAEVEPDYSTIGNGDEFYPPDQYPADEPDDE